MEMQVYYSLSISLSMREKLRARATTKESKDFSHIGSTIRSLIVTPDVSESKSF